MTSLSQPTGAPRSVFLGITGASGAPYALGLLRELAARSVELSLCISEPGVGVVAHELSLPATGRNDVTAVLLGQAGARASVYLPGDFASTVSSGTSFPEAAVICPCSMSSAAHIALGTSATLIHRAGGVALKERRPLVVVPRESPLSAIHLRRLLELAEAGAFVLPPAPGFYHRPQSLQEAIDSVVGKILSVLGFEQDLLRPWDGGTSR